MSATDLATLENRIADRISPDKAQTLVVAPNMGGLVIRDMSQLMEFAKMMAIGGVSVPKHLRGNPGACIAVTLQAIEWRMSPFAVANKSYAVNDRLAYEAQLIHAVILMRAPIQGRPKFEFSGEGATRRCRVWAKLRGEDDIVDYTSPELSRIPIQNSPLWKGDPDQQLGYYSIRALARRHFPDVIMGVVEREETRYNAIEGEPVEVNPQTPKTRPSLKSKLESLVEENPAGDSTPPPEDEIGQGEAIEAEQAAQAEAEMAEAEIDEGEAEDEEADEEEDRDPMFERLKPAALKSQKALRLAIGKLTTEEREELSEETHRRLDILAAKQPQK